MPFLYDHKNKLEKLAGSKMSENEDVNFMIWTKLFILAAQQWEALILFYSGEAREEEIFGKKR